MMTNQKSHQDSVWNVDDIRKDFPILSEQVNGYPLTYVDSAASAQKPRQVVDVMTAVMQEYYANIHRGLYKFSQQTTADYEAARHTVAAFLNAPSDETVVFTRNATEAVNLVAASWGRLNLQEGDEILLTELEHHANIVPWYMLAEEKGLTLKVVPLHKDPALGLDLEQFSALLTKKTKLVAFTHMSNVTGEITPAKQIIQQAKAVGAVTLVDGSQASVHMPVDMQDLDCDFYVCTGHKLYGPTGVGVLYGKADLLNAMPPYQGGGEMIETVSFDKITYKKAPTRFEAGTPAFVEAIGLGAAIDYLAAQDRDAIFVHEDKLATMAEQGLLDMGGIQLFGHQVENKGSIVSFALEGIHPHDAATVLDQMGIALRAGKHCADPYMAARGITATLRASFALYNTEDDVARFLAGVEKVKKLFG